MNKIVIIGDSFCRPYMKSKTRLNEKVCFWVDELKSNLNNEFEIILDAQPSRDAKTILENWIKILPQLSENDFVIICFPSLNRTRLPFHKNSYEYLKSSDEKINIINRFYGTAS